MDKGKRLANVNQLSHFVLLVVQCLWCTLTCEKSLHIIPISMSSFIHLCPRCSCFWSFNPFLSKLLSFGEAFATVHVSIFSSQATYASIQSGWPGVPLKAPSRRFFPHCSFKANPEDIVHIQLVLICQVNQLINCDLVWFHYLGRAVQDSTQYSHRCKLEKDADITVCSYSLLMPSGLACIGYHDDINSNPLSNSSPSIWIFLFSSIYIHSHKYPWIPFAKY